MLIDAMTGFPGFKVIDDSTGQEIKNVLWIDTSAMEYAVMLFPSGYGFFAQAVGAEIDTEVFTVTRIEFDYVNKVVRFNEPPPSTCGITVRELHACDECCQKDTCRRIDYCSRYRCGFGEAKKP